MNPWARLYGWLTSGWSSAAAPAVVATPAPSAVSTPLVHTEPAPPPVVTAPFATVEAPATASLPDLIAMLRAVEWAAWDDWAPVLAGPMRTYGITGQQRMAAFLANCAHETGGGRRLEENLSYSADRICAVWPSRFPNRAVADPFARNPEALANKVYGGRMGNQEAGDGWRFRGRGLIQITGRTNYAAMAARLGKPLDSLPGYIETRPGAAESAAAWWSANGCNEMADSGDMTALRRRINGGTTGLDDVLRRYRAAMAG